MSQLAKYDPAAGLGWSEIEAMSSKLARAQGFVPKEMLGQPHAIAAAILTGQELGIGPMQSLRSIYVIDGRPMLAADLMLSLAIRAGVKHTWLEQTDRVARLRLQRAGFDPHEHVYTLEEAQRAGLARRQNWQRYAPAMLRARCLSAALRAYCPDVLGAGVYVEGEIVPDDDSASGEPASTSPPPRELAPPPREPEPGPGCGDAEPGHPTRLTDVQTAEELRSWLAEWAPRLRGRTAPVVEHGERIGLSAADVERWIDEATTDAVWGEAEGSDG
jgi:hypothetical protein